MRYKQTLIGASWAVIQPFVTMVIFTLFFNKVAGIQSGDTPYAIFSYSGLLFWNYFQSSLTSVSNSLINNSGVITKIYFPRIIIPISSLLVGLVDFLFASVMFIALLIYFQTIPGLLGIAMLVPMLLLAIITSLGLGTFFASLNVKYRDVKSAVPFLVQVLLFLTPVIYPVTLVPQQYQLLLFLNPMTGVITTMRAGLLQVDPVNWAGLLVSTASALFMLVLGIWYFNRTERNFADII